MTEIIQKNDLEEVAPKRRDRIAELERRLERCEAVSRQYERMYLQIEQKLKALSDRADNVQKTYDYMVKVGSTLVTKRDDIVAKLEPDRDPVRLGIKTKFKQGETVFYVDEQNCRVMEQTIKAIDIIDGIPRYSLSGYFGYVHENKIFAREFDALDQLRKWSNNDY